jgi:hypothetical protein
MAEKRKTAQRHVPISSDDFQAHIEEMRFRVFNRVAVTKPLDRFIGLLGLKIKDSNSYENLKSGQDDAEPAIGVIHVFGVTKPRLFGLRLAIRLENDKHLLAVDGSVEYRWNVSLSYPREPLEAFLRAEVIPRLTISVWTLMTEAARSIGEEIPDMPPIPAEVILAAARHQWDKHPESTSAEW